MPLEVRPARHFLIDLDRFRSWMSGRKAPRLEHIDRAMRKESGLLMIGFDALHGNRSRLGVAARVVQAMSEPFPSVAPNHS